MQAEQVRDGWEVKQGPQRDAGGGGWAASIVECQASAGSVLLVKYDVRMTREEKPAFPSPGPEITTLMELSGVKSYLWIIKLEVDH